MTRLASTIVAPFTSALLLFGGCAPVPASPTTQALYTDLRKIVEVSEDSGWTVDRARLELNNEAALRSVCQVDPATRSALAAWLAERIAAEGGPAKRRYRAHETLDTLAETISLERTLALLQYAQTHTEQDCPFWLEAQPHFAGEQGDFGRIVILGETQAFGTITIPGPIPALGGGGRLLVGSGVTQQLTLALGADIAASGTFIPSSTSQGIDAYMTLAAPVLLRWTNFSRLYDLEVAPVMRFSHAEKSWPPGARLELGFGYSAIRTSAWMSYLMFYAGYEVHGFDSSTVDHTFQLGTKLSIDWHP